MPVGGFRNRALAADGVGIPLFYPCSVPESRRHDQEGLTLNREGFLVLSGLNPACLAEFVVCWLADLPRFRHVVEEAGDGGWKVLTPERLQRDGVYGLGAAPMEDAPGAVDFEVEGLLRGKVPAQTPIHFRIPEAHPLDAQLVIGIAAVRRDPVDSRIFAGMLISEDDVGEVARDPGLGSMLGAYFGVGGVLHSGLKPWFFHC